MGLSSEAKESLLQAMDIIANNATTSLPYDSTIKAVIINNDNASDGYYSVQYENTKFTAYSETTTYQVNDCVRVSIPNNDFSEKKYILGKWAGDEGTEPITYVSVSNSILEIMSLIDKKNITDIAIEANGEETVIDLQKYSPTLNSSFGQGDSNSLFDTLFIEASFQCKLDNLQMAEGTYGLKLSIFDKESQVIGTLKLDSSEFFGNPYAFSVPVQQSKKLNISDLGQIKSIRLEIYQDGKFSYYEENQKDPISLTPTGRNNIFVKDLRIGFGSDLSLVEDNTVKVFCNDDVSYEYSERSKKKELGLLWYNKTQDNTYIGFNDGIARNKKGSALYGYKTYDENIYLKETAEENRLKSQQSNSAPSDALSLNLKADVFIDGGPAVKEAYNIISNDLPSTIQSIKSRIGDSNSNDIIEKLTNLANGIASSKGELDEIVSREQDIYTEKEYSQGDIVKNDEYITISRIQVKNESNGSIVWQDFSSLDSINDYFSTTDEKEYVVKKNIKTKLKKTVKVFPIEQQILDILNYGTACEAYGTAVSTNIVEPDITVLTDTYKNNTGFIIANDLISEINEVITDINTYKTAIDNLVKGNYKSFAGVWAGQVSKLTDLRDSLIKQRDIIKKKIPWNITVSGTAITIVFNYTSNSNKSSVTYKKIDKKTETWNLEKWESEFDQEAYNDLYSIYWFQYSPGYEETNSEIKITDWKNITPKVSDIISDLETTLGAKKDYKKDSLISAAEYNSIYKIKIDGSWKNFLTFESISDYFATSGSKYKILKDVSVKTNNLTDRLSVEIDELAELKEELEQLKTALSKLSAGTDAYKAKQAEINDKAKSCNSKFKSIKNKISNNNNQTKRLIAACGLDSSIIPIKKTYEKDDVIEINEYKNIIEIYIKKTEDATEFTWEKFTSTISASYFQLSNGKYKVLQNVSVRVKNTENFTYKTGSSFVTISKSLPKWEIRTISFDNYNNSSQSFAEKQLTQQFLVFTNDFLNKKFPTHVNLGLPELKENEDGKTIWYWNNSTGSENIAKLNVTLDSEKDLEKFKVMIVHNHNRYESKEIVFSNIDKQINLNLTDEDKLGFQIVHGDNSKDNYQEHYNFTGALISSKDSEEERFLKAEFKKPTTDNTEIFNKSWIYWYVPDSATMIKYDEDRLLNHYHYYTDKRKTVKAKKATVEYTYQMYLDTSLGTKQAKDRIVCDNSKTINNVVYWRIGKEKSLYLPESSIKWVGMKLNKYLTDYNTAVSKNNKSIANKYANVLIQSCDLSGNDDYSTVNDVIILTEAAKNKVKEQAKLRLINPKKSGETYYYYYKLSAGATSGGIELGFSEKAKIKRVCSECGKTPSANCNCSGKSYIQQTYPDLYVKLKDSSEWVSFANALSGSHKYFEVSGDYYKALRHLDARCSGVTKTPVFKANGSYSTSKYPNLYIKLTDPTGNDPKGWISLSEATAKSLISIDGSNYKPTKKMYVKSSYSGKNYFLDTSQIATEYIQIKDGDQKKHEKIRLYFSAISGRFISVNDMTAGDTSANIGRVLSDTNLYTYRLKENSNTISKNSLLVISKKFKDSLTNKTYYKLYAQRDGEDIFILKEDNSGNIFSVIAPECSRDGYYCFYKKIDSDYKKVSNGKCSNCDKNSGDCECLYASKEAALEGNKKFPYYIKGSFNQDSVKNTILCGLDGNRWELKDTLVTKELLFGTYGANGTEYSIRVIPNRKFGTDGQLKTELTINLYNGSEEEDFSEPALSWIGPTSCQVESIRKDYDGKGYIATISSKVIGENNEYNFNNYYAVLRIEAKLEKVDLESFYPVPYSPQEGSDLDVKYSISGATSIVYNSFGNIEEKYTLDPYVISKKEDGSIGSVSNVTWTTSYIEGGNGSKGSPSTDEKRTKYMPKIDSGDNVLKPLKMFVSNVDCYTSVICKNSSGNVIWIQPIVIMQNRFMSTTLNKWDGEFMMDEENGGTILSAMIGAGRKNNDNSFSGVLMGDVKQKAGFDDSLEQIQTGLYGFHEGAMSFGFNVDGTAFLGKTGKGRISFNGNYGSISSASWDGEISTYGVTKLGTKGMLIDLENGHIDAHDFRLTSKNVELDSDPLINEHVTGVSGYYIRIGNDGVDNEADRTKGFFALDGDGKLTIRVNSLHLTGQLGGSNLLHQTQPKKNVPSVKEVVNGYIIYNKDNNGNIIYTWDVANKNANIATEPGVEIPVSKWTLGENTSLQGAEVQPPKVDGSVDGISIKLPSLSVSSGTRTISQTIVEVDKGPYTVSGYVKRSNSNASSDEEYTFKVIPKINRNEVTKPIHSTTSNEIKITNSKWTRFEYTFEVPEEKEGSDCVIEFSADANYYLYHAKLEQGSIATNWCPSDEDTSTNIETKTDKYNRYLAQDQIFNKLATNPNTGKVTNGMWMIYNQETGTTDLYLCATYISTGILRSNNFNESVSYNSTTKKYSITIGNETKGVYFNLDEGKMWAGTFELNAWNTSSNKGLYLNSNPEADDAQQEYYLRMGKGSSSYVSFDKNGALKMKVNYFELTSTFGGSNNLLSDTGPLADLPKSGTTYIRNASEGEAYSHWGYDKNTLVAYVHNNTDRGKCLGIYNKIKINESDSPNYRAIHQDLPKKLSSSSCYVLSGWINVGQTSGNKNIVFKLRPVAGSTTERHLTYTYTPPNRGWNYFYHIFDLQAEKVSLGDNFTEYTTPRLAIRDYNLTTFTGNKIADENVTLFDELKLEQGTVATQWCESEQDKKDRLNIYDSEILLQDAVFNKLTNNGAAKGIYLTNGQLYINATYIATGVLKSTNAKLVRDDNDNITRCSAGMYMNLTDGKIWASEFDLQVGSSGKAGYIRINSDTSKNDDNKYIYKPLIIGSKFSVAWDGTLSASNASISGTIKSGTIYAKTLYAGGNDGTSTDAEDYVLRATSTGVTLVGATIRGKNNSTEKFSVTSAGKLTATSAVLTTLTVSKSISLTGGSNGSTGTKTAYIYGPDASSYNNNGIVFNNEQQTYEGTTFNYGYIQINASKIVLNPGYGTELNNITYFNSHLRLGRDCQIQIQSDNDYVYPCGNSGDVLVSKGSTGGVHWSAISASLVNFTNATVTSNATVSVYDKSKGLYKVSIPYSGSASTGSAVTVAVSTQDTVTHKDLIVLQHDNKQDDVYIMEDTPTNRAVAFAYIATGTYNQCIILKSGDITLPTPRENKTYYTSGGGGSVSGNAVGYVQVSVKV